jgi:hypothetical protein
MELFFNIERSVRDDGALRFRIFCGAFEVVRRREIANQRGMRLKVGNCLGRLNSSKLRVESSSAVGLRQSRP